MGAGQMTSLSVVVPAYNERARLGRTLEEMRDHLEGRGLDYEILVVDDGSRDGTSALVQQMRASLPRLRLISMPRNHGKGYMVRVGVINSRCDHVMFADADGATPFAEVEKLEAALADGYDVAIGSRKAVDPTRTVENSIFRSAVTFTFNALVSALVIQGIADTQCGFKLFPRRVALDLFHSQTIDGFSFDVEILYISRLRGYRIAEVPVNWHAVPGSKVHVARDGMRMARDLFLIRSRALRGVYAPAAHPEPVGTAT